MAFSSFGSFHSSNWKPIANSLGYLLHYKFNTTDISTNRISIANYASRSNNPTFALTYDASLSVALPSLSVSDTSIITTSNYLYLDGSNNFLRLNPFTSSSSGTTFAFWVRSCNNINNTRIFEFNNNSTGTQDSDVIFMYMGSNSLNMNVGNVTTTPATAYNYVDATINKNIWRHVVWTISYAPVGATTSVFTLYINGQYVAQSNPANPANYYYHPRLIMRGNCFIGKSALTNNTNIFTGGIYDFRMYNIQMGIDNVTMLFNSYARTSPVIPTLTLTPSPIGGNITYYETSNPLSSIDNINIVITSNVGGSEVTNANITYGGVKSTNSSIIQITSLLKLTSYNLNITFSNTAGNTVYNGGNLTLNTIDYPASNISGFAVTKLDDKSLSLSFSPSVNSVLRYSIVVMNSANVAISGSPFSITHNPDNTTYTTTINGLSQDTSYNLYITAVGTYGNSATYSNSFITYYTPTWVATTDTANAIIYSKDGISWNNTTRTTFSQSSWVTTTETTFSKGAYAVAYGKDNTSNNIWVAVGDSRNTDNNSVSISYNGLYWTKLGALLDYGLAVAYGYDGSGNGLWVAGGSGTNPLITSFDGSVWANGPSLTYLGSTINIINSVAYGKDGSGNSLWMLSGMNSTGSPYCVFSSYNGTTWSIVSSCPFVNGVAKNIAYGYDGSGNGVWAIAGATTNFVYNITVSRDITNWSLVAGNIFGNASAMSTSLVYGKDNSGNRIWTATINSNSYAYSYNATNWTVVSVPNILSTNSIAYGEDASQNNLWVLGSNIQSNYNGASNAYTGNAIAYSNNAVSWNISTSVNNVFSVITISNTISTYTFETATVNGTQLQNATTSIYDATLSTTGLITTSDYKIGTSSLVLASSSSQFVTIGTTSALGTGGISFAFWIKSNNVGYNPIFSFSSGFQNNVVSAGIIGGIFNTNVMSASTPGTPTFGSPVQQVLVDGSGNQTSIYSMAISANGLKLVHLNSNVMFSSSNNGTNWGTLTRTSLAFSNGTTVALSATGDRGIICGNVMHPYFFTWTGSSPSSLTKTLETLAYNIFSVVLTGDGNRVIMVTNSGYIFFGTWNGTNYTSFNTFVYWDNNNKTQRLSVSADGNKLCAASATSVVLVFTWNGTTYANQVSISNAPLNSIYVGISPDANIIMLSGNNLNTFYSVWDGSTYSAFANTGLTVLPTQGMCYVYNDLYITGSSGLFKIKITRPNETKQISSYTTRLNTNTWQHIVWTISSAGVYTFYVNGNAVYTSGSGLTYPANITRSVNYIGRDNYYPNSYFNGGIDNFGIYSGVLSTNDIQLLSNGVSSTIRSLAYRSILYETVLFEPPPVTNLTYSNLTDKSVTILFTPSQNYGSGNYIVYIDGVTRTNINGNTVTFSNILTPYTTYTASVYSIGTYSNSVKATTAPFTTYGPATNITNFTLTGLQPTKTTVRYSASTGNVIGYYLSLSPTITGSPFTITDLSYTFTGLTNLTTYTLSMYAIGTYGNSATYTTTFIPETSPNYIITGTFNTGGNTMITSIDGTTWEGRNSNTLFSVSMIGAAYGRDSSGNELWVGCGVGGNAIAYSYNGASWIGGGLSVFN